MSLYLRDTEAWRHANGDNTLAVDYNLTEDSTIMDLGGFNGVWASQMIAKYNPNVYIVEPIPSFYANLVNVFSNNSKVNLKNIGISDKNKDGFIFINGDGSSSNLTSGEKVSVKFKTIESILKEFGLSDIDLLQINIEGDEYSVLHNMIESGFNNKFKNIQVQFHLGIENAEAKRDSIRQRLIEKGFKIKFDYPFVWESWGK